MKKIIILSALVVNFACQAGFTLETDNVRQVRNVSEFNVIDLSMSGELYLSQGNETKVEVEADIKKIDYVITEVSNGKLKIRKKEPWPRLGKVKIYVTTPDINGIVVSGSGKITAQTDIITQNLFTNVSGSGSINLKNADAGNECSSNVSGSGSIFINSLSANQTHARISGSGDIHINGKKTNDLKVEIAGSGNFIAENLVSASAYVAIAGSGKANVNANEKLTTKISGSGNVNYKGSPLINATSSGSGKTRSLDI